MIKALQTAVFRWSTALVVASFFMCSNVVLAQTSGSGGRQVFEDGHHKVMASTKRGLRGYSTDAVYEEGPYLNNRRSGMWKTYYSNGNLKSEITYNLGRKNGPYVLYYEDGTEMERGNWAKNRMKGEYQLSYENGKPRQKFNYDESGRRDGKQEYFYEDGTPMIVVEFKDGKESGVIERYWPNGDIKMRGNYINGQLDPESVKQYRPKGAVPKEKLEPKDPPKLPKFLYGDYNPNGYSILYNSNKQPVQVGTFKDNRLYTGKVYNYDENGLLIDVDVYKEGRWAGKAVVEE